MRQLVLHGPHELRWEETPEPAIEGPAQAIVRPVAVATCDLDAALIAGAIPFPPPMPLGHEFVADVVDAGDEVASFRVGDRVVVPFQVSCGACKRCARGLTASCTTVQRGSMYGIGAAGGGWGGSLADLVRVPFAEHMLVPLPADVDPVAVASLSDNIPDGWRTVGPQLRERPGADVLVVGGAGPGSVGLYAAGIAAALGAARVDYVDGQAERLAIAERLGATPIERPTPYPKRFGSYPITVDASANTDGLACALRSTEPEGVCTSIGIYFGPETPLPLLEMYTRGVTFRTGRVNARPVIPEALSLITDGRFHPEAVTNAVVAWDDAAEALPDYRVKLVLRR